MLESARGQAADRVRHAVAERCATVRTAGDRRRRIPKGGRPRKWGKRLPSPQEHDKWDVPWQTGRAYVYGRVRTFRYKCLRCCWSVSGPQEIMLRLRVRGARLRQTVGDDHQRRATCRRAKRCRPTADAFDRKMDSAITSNDWAWKNVGRGPRNRSCGPSKSR